MFSLFIIFMIFAENALDLVFPYNFIALPYITYLAYTKKKSAIFQLLLLCLIISRNTRIILGIGVVFAIVYILSYLLTKILEYKFINIGYYILIQVVVYSTYLHIKLSEFSWKKILMMCLGYLLINYIFIVKIRKKI